MTKIKYDNLKNISCEEISHILKCRYKKFYGGSMEVERPLIERSGDNYVTGEFTIFALTGSPPKGYALHIPDASSINFYDVMGTQFGQIHIEGKDAVLPVGSLGDWELNARLSGPLRCRLLR
jgi:hypothetical protein